MSKHFSWTLTIITTVFAIFCSVWAMDAHFTPREIHETCKTQGKKNLEIAMQNVQQQFIRIQRTGELNRARAAVRHWTQQYVTLSIACANNPNNQALRNQLNNAIYEKEKAEQYLKRLECK